MTVFKNRLMKNSSIIATLLLIILIATASFLSGRKIYSMERQRNLELLHNELRIWCCKSRIRQRETVSSF